MVDTKDRVAPDANEKPTIRSARLEAFRQRIFKHGVEKDSIPDVAVNYLDDPPPAELRFVPLERPHHCSTHMFEDVGLEPASLRAFIGQLPKRLEYNPTFKNKFGPRPAFIFQGADGCLWIWYNTISGCRIDRFPLSDTTVEIEKVWLVGYKP